MTTYTSAELLIGLSVAKSKFCATEILQLASDPCLTGRRHAGIERREFNFSHRESE